MVSFPVWLFDCICITLVVAFGFAAVVRRHVRVMCAVLLVVGLMLLAEAFWGWQLPAVWHANPPLAFGFFPIQFRIDSMSAIFIGLFGAEIAAVSLFSAGYLKDLGREVSFVQYWTAMFLFILGMILTVHAADAVSFLVFWEVMSLCSAALVACGHQQHKVQEAAIIYVGATRTATAFLMGGFVWMHALSHSWKFLDWHFADPNTWWAAVLIMVGFAIKAGSWPFHLWVPYTYPAAPATASALMSGAMSKVALYGMIQILVLGGFNCMPAIYLLMFLGTVSAFWGVLFGLVVTDVKKLLAYSSVENTGLICLAIACSMHARVHGLQDVAGIALAAAILQIVNHGLFKSLLFLGTGAIEAQAKTRDLNLLGGLAKRMPVTMLCFLIASAAICALPPLNGFAGKWLVYQALLRTTFESTSLIDRSIAFAIMGVLALVGGLSLTMFTKAIGVTFLGNARSKGAASATEGTRGMQLSQLLLALGCVAIGALLPFVLKVLDAVVVTAYGGASSLPAAMYIPLGYIVCLLALPALLVYYLVLRSSKVREFTTWDCGFGQLSPRTQVSAESFSQPIASIFSPLLRYQLSIQIRGKDHRHFPEDINIEPRMVSVLERRVYRPALHALEACAKAVSKLQAGSIHLYLFYVCLTLIVLLVVGTRL